MSVGIYIPCYNVGKYIEESLNSIINQTYKNWEIVILDDCSTDKTFEIANKYKSEKIGVHKKDFHSGKIGYLKNYAISLLKNNHDYICHVGSDDYIIPECLEIFTNYLDKNENIGACCGNFICFDNTGKKWSFPHVTNSEDFNPDTLLRYMNLFPMRFYRKSIVDKVGGYDNNLTSAVDYDLALKISEITKIHRIKNPVTYYYRQHSEQVSTKERNDQDLNAKLALQNALKRRGVKGIVENNSPPFIIKYIDEEKQFIWSKK